MPPLAFPSRSLLSVIGLAGLLASCAAPPPQTVKAVVPPPAVAAPTPAPLPADWRDRPLTEGTWRYVPGDTVSSARYGVEGKSALIFRCDRATRQIAIMREGTATEISILTPSGEERRPAGRIDDGTAPMTGALFSANDALLDRIAFSRGRFAVGGPGLKLLIVPAWAEPARAIEDCRK